MGFKVCYDFCTQLVQTDTCIVGRISGATTRDFSVAFSMQSGFANLARRTGDATNEVTLIPFHEP